MKNISLPLIAASLIITGCSLLKGPERLSKPTVPTEAKIPDVDSPNDHQELKDAVDAGLKANDKQINERLKLDVKIQTNRMFKWAIGLGILGLATAIPLFIWVSKSLGMGLMVASIALSSCSYFLALNPWIITLIGFILVFTALALVFIRLRQVISIWLDPDVDTDEALHTILPKIKK